MDLKDLHEIPSPPIYPLKLGRAVSAPILNSFSGFSPNLKFEAMVQLKMRLLTEEGIPVNTV